VAGQSTETRFGKKLHRPVHTFAIENRDRFDNARLVVVAGMPGVTIIPPWILGADATGVIDAIGDLSGISDNKLQVGDNVIINPGISDYTCEYCQSGEHSLCVSFKLLGEHLPGTIAEYICVPAQNVRAIPRDRHVEQAAAFTKGLKMGTGIDAFPPARWSSG